MINKEQHQLAWLSWRRESTFLTQILDEWSPSIQTYLWLLMSNFHSISELHLCPVTLICHYGHCCKCGVTRKDCNTRMLILKRDSPGWVCRPVPGITGMFCNTLSQLSACFANVELLALLACEFVNNILGCALALRHPDEQAIDVPFGRPRFLVPPGTGSLLQTCAFKADLHRVFLRLPLCSYTIWTGKLWRRINFWILWWILSDLKGNFRKALNEFAQHCIRALLALDFASLMNTSG